MSLDVDSLGLLPGAIALVRDLIHERTGNYYDDARLGQLADRQFTLGAERQQPQARRLSRRAQGSHQGIEGQWRIHRHGININISLCICVGLNNRREKNHRKPPPSGLCCDAFLSQSFSKRSASSAS